jgi:hypothetical protein
MTACMRLHQKEKPPGPLVTGGIPIRQVRLPHRIKHMMPHSPEGGKLDAASGILIVNDAPSWAAFPVSVW